MEEKMLKEMITLLSEIKDRLTVQPGINVRGPVADPGPDFYHGHFPKRFPWPIGYNVDPSPEFFFGKEEIARIKVKELDMVVNQITDQLDLIKMQRDLIKAEFKIK